MTQLVKQPETMTTTSGAPVIYVHHQVESTASQVSPYLQYGGPYAAGLAAVMAASVAAVIALKGINAARDNLIAQLDAQRRISARVSRASVVSANRQKWIDALREDLASFLAADFALLDDNNVDEDDLSEVEKSRLYDRIREAKQTRRLMQRRIQLRLNMEKSHHEALYKDIRALMPATGEEHRTIRVRLIKSAQSFLRAEWLRVKAEAGDWEDAVSSEAQSSSSEPKSVGRWLKGKVS